MNSAEEAPFVGFVGIEGDRIALVTRNRADAEAFAASHPEVRRFDAEGRLLMPGLVDTHSHAAMTLQRGTADDIALMEWLHHHVWPFERKQTAEEVLLGFELGVAEMLLGGVTSFVDMYFHEDRCVEVAERMGIRTLLGCSYFDGNIDEAFGEMERAMALSAGSERVRIAVAPHSPYTVSPENLLRGEQFAHCHGLRLTIHVSETQEEVRIMRERYGKTTVEHLDALGLLDDRVICAHCIHVTDEDIATLVRRGAVVSHNPQGNMKLASGVAPIERMRRAGAVVTIGTDGPCSNNDLDMWEEMRSASLLQKCFTEDPCAVPAYEILKMATVEGARAMGYGDELGVVREGALADVILVDLQKPHMQPMNNLVANLVYCGKAADVETVVVGGELVVENRRVLHTDLKRLYAGVNAAVHRIKAQR